MKRTPIAGTKMGVLRFLKGGAIAAVALPCALCAGCSSNAGEEVGVAREAALNPNALNPNALNPNALNPNALNPNALNPNALNPNALSPEAMDAIEDPGEAGALSRELLRYTVGCALSSNQSFDFSWTDADSVVHMESYPGLLGLAPYWATQALDLPGQQWVSSCLASRVNAEGVSVMLSSRGAHTALATTTAERSTYQTREGVFFGNLFTTSPRVYACYDPLSVLPSQMARRVCTEPELLDLDLGVLSTGYDCGPIEVVGPCYGVLGLALGVCTQESLPDRYLYHCTPPGGGGTVPSITTFLAGSIPW
ncbi:MAG: hypothetical protein U0359_15295 [Byssovorax sp.]